MKRRRFGIKSVIALTLLVLPLALIKGESIVGHETPKMLSIENDIPQFLELNALFQSDVVLNAVKEDSSWKINDLEIPFNPAKTEDPQSEKSAIVPVYHNKVTLDGKLGWAALATIYFQRSMPSWVKSVLNVIPSVHVTYNCSLDDSHFNEEKYLAELVYNHTIVRELLKNPKKILEYFVSDRARWSLSGFYLYLPELKL